MSRLTITLSQERYRALKETSAQRNKTIGQLIEESLDFYGIKSRDSARELVRRARDRTGRQGGVGLDAHERLFPKTAGYMAGGA